MPWTAKSPARGVFPVPPRNYRLLPLLWFMLHCGHFHRRKLFRSEWAICVNALDCEITSAGCISRAPAKLQIATITMVHVALRTFPQTETLMFRQNLS